MQNITITYDMKWHYAKCNKAYKTLQCQWMGHGSSIGLRVTGGSNSSIEMDIIIDGVRKMAVP